ncbi:MAG: SpoIIE family protein phosphatase [Leptospiraceae bacterium]|nr:SpoIIE family protein phosphatase [Leptospiraceae bacterium]
MKTISYLIIFLLSFPILSNPLKISLTQNCITETCNPRIWYLIDSFDSSFFSITIPPENWKSTDKFPIWLNTFFKKEGDIVTYTMISFFDLQENLSINRQTGIRLGEIGEVFEIYINGNLVTTEGKVENGKIVKHRTVRGQVYEFDKSFLKERNNQLLIKIIGDPKFDHTGFYLTNGYDIGLYEDLQHEEQDRITLILIGIYIIIGFYHLFLFFKRKKEKHNMYYALFSICLGIYIYTRTSAVFELQWDTTLIQRIELCVLYPMIFFVLALQEQIFFHRIRKITTYYGYFLFLWSAISVFVPMYIAEHLLRIWQLSFITLGLGIAGNIIYTSVKNKIPNAKRLMFGLIFLTSAAIFDILDSLIFNTGIALSKYAFFIYVFGFATVLANNFIQIHNEIEHLNETLEKKVEDRTKELSNSLEKVNELKNQQDGDYYLTSLLIDPLGVNHADKETINVEFLLRQKKKFNFKGNSSELGGDLCRTETIQLKNKSFTVFFNADAMGKSMQGAGGAIVVGAVFDSIIERTKLSKSVQNSYPERWLKNSFVELHKVFESFDCTMLVSIVIGLVDTNSGLLYYINAEHPYPVLYRDGKASFIGEDFLYRKLGMPVNENANICVDTFQLKQGDIFISGSDGRDDVIIIDANGESTLNTNERIFLKTVEISEGDLHKILKILTQNADLTDDLSLLKINLFRNPFPFPPEDLDSIIIENPTLEFIERKTLEQEVEDYEKSKKVNIRKLKYLTYNLLKIGDYQNAFRFGKEYLEWMPADIQTIFLLSENLKQMKVFDEAIELGERLRLRRKSSINNLINLAECYIGLGQKERAKLLLNDVLSSDKNNILATELLDQIIE